MADGTGVGVGGLTSSREDYTTSRSIFSCIPEIGTATYYVFFFFFRYDHYAEFEFENEIVKRETFIYYPQSIAAYNGTMPIKIQIPAEVDRFTRLPSIRCLGDIEVYNRTKKALVTVAETDWSLINNPIHSLFGQVVMSVNDHEIVDSSNNPYPLKAYVETLLTHSKEYQEQILSADLFYKDTAQSADTNNTAYDKRKTGIKNGGKRQFCIPLHCDLVTAKRDLPPGYRLEIKMTRMLNDFVFWVPQKAGPDDDDGNPTWVDGDEYEIRIDNLRISIDKVTVVDKIFNYYFNGLKKIPEIPFTRNMVR